MSSSLPQTAVNDGSYNDGSYSNGPYNNGPYDDRLPACPDHPGAEETRALREALVDSRQRWRDMVLLAADFAFETDAAGRLVFVAPEDVLGWPASMLLGQPAELLLAEGDDAGFNPFRPSGPVRRRRGWLRAAGGQFVCMSFAAVPLRDGLGRIVGARGVGQDMTDQDSHDGAVAASLRRGELLHHILSTVREEVMAPRMMQTALETLSSALGAEGCAVIDLVGDGGRGAVLHATGSSLALVQDTAVMLLERCGQAPAQASDAEGRRVMVCPGQTRFGERTGFVLWRGPGARDWEAEERELTAAATGIIRFILEHEAIQREMARQARTDLLTGLLNRRAFFEETDRRLERLEHEGVPGTLIFVDLDNFKALNDRHGHEAGDRALGRAAALLRDVVRPTDLVARFGGDEFALWLDGADEFTAAERAEALRLGAAAALAEPSEDVASPGIEDEPAVRLGMSIGIATRWPGQNEEMAALIHRADQAMYEVKRNGRGHWRMSRAERT